MGKATFAAACFIVCLAMCFSCAVLKVAPFRLIEAVYCFGISITLGAIALLFAVPAFCDRSRRLSSSYPATLKIQNGSLSVESNGTSSSVSLENVYYWEDVDGIWYPQVKPPKHVQLYLWDGKVFAACGATIQAVEAWRTILSMCAITRMPSFTDIAPTCVCLLFFTIAGKVTGAVFGATQGTDVYGALIGFVVGFLIARVRFLVQSTPRAAAPR